MSEYDSVVIVSFGGPEGRDDVIPFLENVTASRDVPRRRLETVAQQYETVGGVSPLNEQCRRLQVALREELRSAGHDLPVYWGNRNWRPFLSESVAEMTSAGHRRALAVVTSAYSSYSGCRQYLEDIETARSAAGPSAPQIHKLRPFHNHPGFVEPFVDAAQAARAQLSTDLQPAARLVCTAHSLPVSMASQCDYEAQLHETARLVAAGAGLSSWDLLWQSRSGPAGVPWLEPDINDFIRSLSDCPAIVVAPIGFVSDHMEVVWDLDCQARATADECGIEMVRAVAPGTEPDVRFVSMLRELIEERLDPQTPRRSLGTLGVRPDVCSTDCCPSFRAV